MTYAEKLAKATAQKMYDDHLPSLVCSLAEGYICNAIEQAMQAQKEADAQAAWEKIAFMHQTDYENASDFAIEVKIEIKQAILNAEVKA